MKRPSFIAIALITIGLAACSERSVREAPPPLPVATPPAAPATPQATAWTNAPIASFLADVGAPFGLSMKAEGTAATATVTHAGGDVLPGVVLADVLRTNGWILVVEEPTGQAIVCDPEWYSATVDEGNFRRADYKAMKRSAEDIAAVLATHAFLDAVVRVDPAANALHIAGIAETVGELEVLAAVLDKPRADLPPATARFLDESVLVRILNSRQRDRETAAIAAGTASEEVRRTVEKRRREGRPPAPPVSSQIEPSSDSLTREERLRLHEVRVRWMIEERRRSRLEQPEPAP